MTAYDKTGDAGTVGHSAIKRVPYLVENTVDMSGFDPTHSPADTVQMLNIPAETCVLAAGLEVLTVSPSSVVYDLGITSVDADIFVDAHDATSTGYAQFDAVDATAMLTVSSADTLDLLVGGAQDTSSKIRVWAIMCDISGVDETDRN